jgi:hypothetical protein
MEKDPSQKATSATADSPTESSATPDARPDDIDIEIGGDTHEPPVIIGNGSLFLELPARRNIKFQRQAPGDPRPFKYVTADGADPARSLETVNVLRQLKAGSGSATLRMVSLVETDGCILKIWLQTVMSGGPLDFKPFDPEPDFLIRGAPLLIESKVLLANEVHSHKNHCTHRYVHPGFRDPQTGLDPDFRIGKWQIVKGDGTDVALEADDDGYMFFITFHHH